MKTAVSLSDELYQEAEKTARSMGIPRSRLFAKALEEFIGRHRKDGITGKLDEVYGRIDTDERPKASTVGLETLRNLTKHDAW